MGLGMFGSRSSGCGCIDPLPNPDPKNFEILFILQLGEFVVAEIGYPGCTNYEGKKILVFKGVTQANIVALDFIDPHFCDDKHISPVARFEPTREGFNLAVKMCRMAT